MKFAKFAVLLLVALVFICTVTTPAIAEEEGFLAAPWRFHVNLYGWLPEAPATISVDGKEVVDVPEDLDTILDSLEAAAMFELEAHKGRFSIFAHTVYYKGDYDQHYTGPVTGLARKFELEEEVWLIKYGVGYELGTWNLGVSDDSPTLTLIPWVGGFYMHDDWSLKIDPAAEFPGDKVTGTFEYNTPMAGLSSRWKLSERWMMNLSYSYGGWGVDDVDETYDFVGAVGYGFKMGNVLSKVFAGYRYLYIDWQDNQDVKVELTAKGPFFGIGWEF